MKKYSCLLIFVLLFLTCTMNVSASYIIDYYIPENYLFFYNETYAENNTDYIFKFKDEVIESGLIFTGCIAESIDTEKSFLVVVSGDVNCDGKRTAVDARTALRVSAGLEKLPAEEIFTGLPSDSIGVGYRANISAVAADYNKSGDITAADARLILRNAAKLDTGYCEILPLPFNLTV